ncbi:trifunctional histidinol dehydrogenase [Lecanora helva]
MAEQFLIHIDLDILPNGLDLKTIAYLRRVYIVISPNHYEQAFEFLEENVHRFDIYFDCTALTNLKQIILLLNSGAKNVFITSQQLEDIVSEELLVGEDIGRLLVSVTFSEELSPENNVESIRSQLRNLINVPVGIQIRGVHDLESLDSIYQISQDERHSIRYVPLVRRTRDRFARAIKGGNVPIIPASEITMDAEHCPELLPMHRLFTATLQSDRLDGLFPTIVADQRGTCLGLVYSNEKSIETALQLGRGVYHSRRHGLWKKGDQSGNAQELISIAMDCDTDTLQFNVKQEGQGFCHLNSSTCFGQYSGFSRLQKTLQDRKKSAPQGSYTARLFSEPKLLEAKIMEEASELREAKRQKDIAAETADLFYFALTKCIAEGVSIEDIEKNLDLKSLKVTRRKGDAKPQWAEKAGLPNGPAAVTNGDCRNETVKEAASAPKAEQDSAGLRNGRIQMKRYKATDATEEMIKDALQRPSQRSTDQIMGIVRPIVDEIRSGGDAAVLKYTHKFEKATSLSSPVLHAPFPQSLMQLPPETIEAIDISYENIRRFHAAQKEERPLKVETMPGVVCSRFSRPIDKVGLYIPGGTAVLPSTALMLGVPATVAGCRKIVLASPPRSDGTITPEIVYVAHKIGAESIVLAGGAQAVAAMAYGTESISKVDKILGPGNQFVTAGKMLVSNDTTANVSIDMPAGPSEVLVIADKTANPAFVASDLLSQAEHGTDSQVVLIAVGLEEERLSEIEAELNAQANALPRKDIVRGAIEHSVTLIVEDINKAMTYSNQYAPEHLILQVENAEAAVDLVQNAGSVFIGPWTPESVGDYSAGVNHSLPTYGYAKQYSGVSLSSFTKHITSSNLTQQGLKNVSGAVMQLAKVEELEAHRRAVGIRLNHMGASATG